MLFALLLFHAILSVAAAPLARRLGRGVFVVCGLAPLSTVVWAATQAGPILDGQAITETVDWVPALGLSVTLRLDGFSLLMVGLVSGIGALIFAYAASYFSPRPDLGRFTANLTAFAGAMLGLVLADNLIVLYVFWELTSITSYLLIGFEDTKGSARAAALQALLVTVAGGLVMLAGFVMLGQSAGTYSLSGILAQPPTGGIAASGVFLTLVGAFTKSAQAPFHAWLPGAMAAPTPVSAYLHSATMVKAGVYLIARLAPAFALTVGWRPVVVGVGVITMLLGGWRALRQHDLKLLLAFGTVSQLGFMVALFGAGTEETIFAGVVLVMAHALFKAALFLVTGIIDKQAGTRDLRRLSGLGRRLPATAAVATVAAVSMAGIPPLLGFIAKEAAYDAFLHTGLGLLGPLALVGLVAGSVLTFAYSARFVFGAFADRADADIHDYAGPDCPPPSQWFLAPAAVLAALTVVAGMFPSLADPLAASSGEALIPGLDPDHLSLWHGFTPALALSALTVAAGLILVAAKRSVEAAQARVGGWPGSYEAYRWSVGALNRLADRLTGTVQNGSLPVYVGVILVTMVGLPASSLLALGQLPTAAAFAESWVQVAVAGAVSAAALGLIWAQRRFTAVLFLGGVGFGVSLLFVIQGAPDLALTQFLIETLTLVIFVLVLRHLPDRFRSHRWPLGQGLRWGLAIGVGVFAASFVLLAGSVDHAPSVAEQFLAAALPEGGGKNVVNVILVDFRGIDTFGEITVLAVAALGIAGLVRASLPSRQQGEE